MNETAGKDGRTWRPGDWVRLVSTSDGNHEGALGAVGTVEYVLPGRVRVHYDGGATRLTMEDGIDVLERVQS